MAPWNQEGTSARIGARQANGFVYKAATAVHLGAAIGTLLDDIPALPLPNTALPHTVGTIAAGAVLILF
jgi:hypothetical protein